MTYAPHSLEELRDYVLDHTKLAANAVGIVGDKAHTYGRHLGADRLPRNDYSTIHPRDRAGLSNAAAAIDIGSHARLVRLTMHLVREAQAGRLPDVAEIIGPAFNGRAYQWMASHAYRPQLRAPGDSHEEHLHVGYYRDSERRSKLAPFKAFYEDGQPAHPPTAGASWMERAVKNLPTLRQGADGADVRTLQGLLHARGYTASKVDGDFGPKTETSVKRFQAKHDLDVDGIVGPKTWAKLLGV